MKFIVFDIDYTLLNTFVYQARAVELAIKDVFGIEGSLKELSYWGAGKMTLDVIHEICKKRGVSSSIVDSRYQDVIESIYKNLIQLLPQDSKESLLPGVPKTLQHLASYNNLGVISGNPERLATTILKWAGIYELFKAGCFGNEAADRQEMIEKCLKKHNLTDERTIIINEVITVGDSVSDMESSKKAGSIPIGVTTGLHKKDQLLVSGAQYVIETLNELPNIIDKL